MGSSQRVGNEAASPSYHGYDATNYYRVNPQFGSDEDFTRFIAAAYRH